MTDSKKNYWDLESEWVNAALLQGSYHNFLLVPSLKFDCDQIHLQKWGTHQNLSYFSNVAL